MSHVHAVEEPVARAEAIQMDAEESDEVLEPRLLQLYLDSDGLYRWYEEEAASDVAARGLIDAVEKGQATWTGLQVVEFRGQTVRPDSELDDAYAPDELEELEEE